MVLKLPDCPASQLYLERLIYSLTDPKYKNPDEARKIQYMEELKRRRISKGISRLLEIAVGGFTEEDEQIYAQMLEWGNNQKSAARHFMMHITSGCNPCLDHYFALLGQNALELAEEDGVNDITRNPELFMKYFELAHAVYLGQIDFKKRKWSLEDLFNVYRGAN